MEKNAKFSLIIRIKYFFTQKEFYMRQRRLELIKDYDCTISYHLRKANVVADVLSWKSLEAVVAVLNPQIFHMRF